jgi:hypothetical protein
MKKSDLKKHIKEEILSILKEATTALVTTKGGTKPVSFTSPTELNALKTDANVSSITTTAGQKIKETQSQINSIKNKLDSLGVKYDISTTDKVKQFKVIYKPIDKPDEWYVKFNNIIDLNNLKGVVKSAIKEAKIESDFFEREPKSKDIEKGEGIIAKTKKLLNFQKELKTLSKDMQDLAAEYREAEGSDKDEILRSLKVKTAAKKELEKKIEQLEKYV